MKIELTPEQEDAVIVAVLKAIPRDCVVAQDQEDWDRLLEAAKVVLEYYVVHPR